jgi:hypothetical protein
MSNMSYEDEEILWMKETETLESLPWMPLANANLAIRLNLSKNTFDVFKNRWGEDSICIPLNLLDCFLEDPGNEWKKIIDESDVDNQLFV